MTSSTGAYRSRRSAVEALAARAAAARLPLSATLEVADRCNEACAHCYQIQGTKGELSTAQLERVMDELAELGVLILVFSGGEATLRADFLHLVAYARQLSFAVKIYSNGLRITDELAAELGRLAVQEVQLSLYSHRAEVHDWVTRVPGSRDAVVRAARALRAAGVGVVLKTPLMEANAAELDDYVALARQLDADYAFDPQMLPREDGERGPQSLGIEASTYRRVVANARQEGGEEKRRAASLQAAPCGACSSAVHMEANGQLQPCGLWSIPTGRADQEGVAQAWSNNPVARVVRSLTWRDLPGCRVCDLQPHCVRCFSSASLLAGNALLPYDQACARARLEYELATGEPAAVLPEGAKQPPTGPYRHIEGHRFLAEPVRLEERDRALLAEHAWLQAGSKGAAAAPAPKPVRPGQLVELRRPGRRPLTERVPGPSTPERLP